MTDLEALFRPLIDESAPYREPVGVIEARVRERRVRRRRLRAQYRFGAAFFAVALIAVAVGIVHARNDPAPVRPGHVAATTTSSLPSVIAPAGWSTYDYGLARLSIPPGWTAATGCRAPKKLVLFDPNNVALGCDAVGGPSINIGPLQSADCGACAPDASVNGIPYGTVLIRCLGAQCPMTIYVPALKVSISFIDARADAATIMQTLTYSTYARVLQQPFGPVPSSWKTVTFQGFSVRVPSNWPTVDLRKTGFCYPEPNTVYVGTPAFANHCAFRPAGQPPEASLQLETTDVSSPPSDSGGWHHNGLRFTRQNNPVSTPLATQLLLNVDGPHGRLLVTLGLGLDPAVARGILGSLNPIG